MKIFGVPQSFCIRASRDSFKEYENIGTASLGSCSAIYAEFNDGTIFFGHFMASQNKLGSKKDAAVSLISYFAGASVVKVWYSSEYENMFTKDESNTKKLQHPELKLLLISSL